MSRVNKEKYFKETRAYRNCNPLNIRATKARWQGQIGQDDKGFVKFISFDKGYRAVLSPRRSEDHTGDNREVGTTRRE